MTTTERVSPSLGAKVYVQGERRPYRVRARNERFAVCTKPHFHTVLYCILDAECGWRAPEGLVFEMGAESDEQCQAMLDRVTNGQTELSRRRGVPWDVVRVVESTAARAASTTGGGEVARG